jgi:putative oxygen-independent coproporphyrinogen III oxidase
LSEETGGFGVYIHWPFCAAKCPYCDFNSHVRHGGVDVPRFQAALLAELATMAQLQPDRPVHSIFFGGGTPSLMPASLVGALIDAVAKHWPTEPGLEITLEANPQSVDAGRFAGYHAAGVNRVSLGVQALNDRDLKFLGRLHNAAEAKVALGVARQTFERVSFDLIYARPDQGVAEWSEELRQAIGYGPDHLSVYQLTIEDGTPFAALHKAGKIITPPAELADDLYAATQDLTEAAGLPAYEVSNHARPGQECRHNMVYWRYGTYAGIGPGAHGRLMVDGTRMALSTQRNPEIWASAVEQDGHGLVERTPLSLPEQADERLIMGCGSARDLIWWPCVPRPALPRNRPWSPTWRARDC